MIPAIPFLSIYPRGKKIYVYIRPYTNVTSSLTCNSQKLQKNPNVHQHINCYRLNCVSSKFIC